MSEIETSQLHPDLGIPWQKMPRHVAVIMDGNGRWAENRGLPRIEGHRHGSKSVRSTITAAAKLRLECLTLYSFSTENWKRPAEEVSALMELYRHYLISERAMIMNSNIRVRHLGDEKDLPEPTLRELRETVRLSKGNTGMTLCLALNYSGRHELARVIRKLAGDVKNQSLKSDDITEQLISDSLDTAGLPDPDLLIRTAGEKRISNFLLWQISYAELYVTDVYWPDFTPEVLAKAVLDYSARDRRFGGLLPKNL